MNATIAYIVEGTITAIVLAWVITHSSEFSQIANASSAGIVKSVSTLWNT